MLAKVVLAPLVPWKEQRPQAHLSSWVDDVVFDLKADTPLQVAQQAVAAYRDLYKEGGQPKQCPICQVPATPKHIIWLRKWHHQQQHKPMPPEWAERILHHLCGVMAGFH